MKQFELTLVWTEQDKFKSMDKIEADDLVHLLSQFMFVIVNLQRKINEEKTDELRDDDIPF